MIKRMIKKVWGFATSDWLTMPILPVNPAAHSVEQAIVREDETIKVALMVIDRLLALPAGEQLYAREIKMLFELITLQVNPPITLKGKSNV